MTVANDTCSVFQFIKLARKNTLKPWEMEIVSVVELPIRVQRGGVFPGNCSILNSRQTERCE